MLIGMRSSRSYTGVWRGFDNMTDKKTQIANIGAAALAGISISIGGMALLKQGNGFGTVLFSIGLMATFFLGGRLCTGMFGYVNSGKTAVNALIALAVNAIAAYICGVLYKSCCGEAATMATKLAKPLYHVFLSGIVCGMLIYIAVEGWRQTGQILAIIMPVAAFVGIGAEHCIADAFFIGAGKLDGYTFVWWLCSVAGNFVGAQLAGFLKLKVQPAANNDKSKG